MASSFPFSSDIQFLKPAPLHFPAESVVLSSLTPQRFRGNSYLSQSTPFELFSDPLTSTKAISLIHVLRSSWVCVITLDDPKPNYAFEVLFPYNSPLLFCSISTPPDTLVCPTHSSPNKKFDLQWNDALSVSSSLYVPIISFLVASRHFFFPFCYFWIMLKVFDAPSVTSFLTFSQ